MSSLFVSGSVALTAAVGLVIAIFYVEAMWGALQKAVQTRDDPEEQAQDTYRYSLLGAVSSVLVSSIAIAAYGVAPVLLYLGPILALASPIAVTYCLRQEQRGQE
jgi:hypothetical protein